MKMKWDSWIEGNGIYAQLIEEFSHLLREYSEKYPQFDLGTGYYLKPNAGGDITIYPFAKDTMDHKKHLVLSEMVRSLKHGKGFGSKLPDRE